MDEEYRGGGCGILLPKRLTDIGFRPILPGNLPGSSSGGTRAVNDSTSSLGYRSPLQQFVFFDLETTGLSPNGDRVIEIAALRVGRYGCELGSFHSLVRVDRRLPSFITKLTGISDGLLQDQEPINQVLPRFVDFIADDVLVSYNIPFDMGFLQAEAGRLNAQVQNVPFCALQVARRRLPDLSNHKLKTVAAYFGLDSDQNHHALDDCRMGLNVLINLMSTQALHH